MSNGKFISTNKRVYPGEYTAPSPDKVALTPEKKGELHSRNRHLGRYDFKELQKIRPALKEFMTPNHAGKLSVDFANPEAVKLLNSALLEQFYGVKEWTIPEQYLCPPIPGRADYIHHIADILAVSRKHVIPRGDSIRILDIGTGANCIYPILGNCEYGWKFVGTDIDAESLAVAQKILDANPEVAKSVELRLQKSKTFIFQGIINRGEKFDAVVCNPPFHSSAEEAEDVNTRKWRNLGKAAVTNFGGTSNELWCEGGELAFIRRMIIESSHIPEHVQWFTAFVSKELNMPDILVALDEARVLEYRTIHMMQGQKKSRFIAWTFVGGKTPFVSSA
jgi:23S rRNA (adenine1618-N6)-methyltransferase